MELFQKIDLDDIFGDSDRTPKNVMPLVMNMKSLRKMIQHDEDNTKLTNVALKDEHHQKKYWEYVASLTYSTIRRNDQVSIFHG